MNTWNEPLVPYGKNKQNFTNASPFKFIPNYLFEFFAIQEKTKRQTPLLTFTWEGGLKELKNEFDGVRLQHDIRKLREDSK